MPLNIDQPDNVPEPENPPAEPVLHEPPKSTRGKFPVVVIVSIVLMLVAIGAGYLIWQLDIFGWNKPHSAQAQPSAPKETVAAPVAVPRDTVSNPHPEDAVMPAQPQDSTANKENVPATEVQAPEQRRPRPVSKAGTYTIYISRHRTKVAAEDESARWKEGGYESFVSEEEGWFRVSIGRYLTWDEAKATAEDLKDAFESGYRIGTIAE